MYHGRQVQAFRATPPGFRTITLVRKGFVDPATPPGPRPHGNGDVQWMTAAKGFAACEMFPLMGGPAQHHGAVSRSG